MYYLNTLFYRSIWIMLIRSNIIVHKITNFYCYCLFLSVIVKLRISREGSDYSSTNMSLCFSYVFCNEFMFLNVIFFNEFNFLLDLDFYKKIIWFPKVKIILSSLDGTSWSCGLISCLFINTKIIILCAKTHNRPKFGSGILPL